MGRSDARWNLNWIVSVQIRWQIWRIDVAGVWHGLFDADSFARLGRFLGLLVHRGKLCIGGLKLYIGDGGI